MTRRLLKSTVLLAVSVALLPGALACAWAIEEVAKRQSRGWS